MARRRVDEATFSKASFVKIPSLDGYLKPVTVYGKSTQAGTPTPDVPVPIVSTTGDVTVTSRTKNFLNRSTSSGTSNGITFTINADGSITITGTATANAYRYLAGFNLQPNTTYTLSGITGGSVSTYRLEYDYTKDGVATYQTSFSNPTTFTSGSVNTGGTPFIFVNSGATVNTTIYPQIEIGSTATAFESPSSSTQTLPLGTTQLRSLPNGVSDRIYKSGSSWFLEQNVGELTLTGTEAWTTATSTGSPLYTYAYTSAYDSILPNTVPSITSSMSNRFAIFTNTLVSGSVVTTDTISLGGTAGVIMRLMILTSRLATADSAGFKTWLAANPTTSTYPLRTPTTTAITDPTLITALENIRTYQGVTNITASTPISGVYLPNSLRTAATNRVAVQDMKSSLSFNGTSS